VSRATTLQTQSLSLDQQLSQTETELKCFKELYRNERLAAPKRIRDWTRLVDEQKQRQRRLQSKYGSLLDQLRGYQPPQSQQQQAQQQEQ